MTEFKDIRDDEIRVIGEDKRGLSFFHKPRVVRLAILSIVLVGVAYFLVTGLKNEAPSADENPSILHPSLSPETGGSHWLGSTVDTLSPGFTELRDTLINDVPIRIYIPHNARMSLSIGIVDKSDLTVIYVARAADVRADNGGIVGAFVLNGKPLSWGLSKSGYCASIDGKVSVGVAENSPLFEEATEKGGFFFRQYPLVKDGKVVENELKGKSIRRAVCDRQGEIFMVETCIAESFHEFAQALADLGVDQAVYLVGSSAYGWAVDEAGVIHEFGEDNSFDLSKNTSYIVWKRK